MNPASLLDCEGFYFLPKQMPNLVEILSVYRVVSNCLKSYFLMSHAGFIYHGVKMQIHALINLTSSRTFENNYSHLKMHTLHGFSQGSKVVFQRLNALTLSILVCKCIFTILVCKCINPYYTIMLMY